MVRGIKNISGVSCHISCALQIICHVIKPLRQALLDTAEKRSSAATSRHFLSELGLFFQELEETGEALDPTSLYQNIEKILPSIDQNEVGDASTVLYELLVLIRKEGGDEWKVLLEKTVLGGETRQLLTGTKKEGAFLLKRTKIAKAKSMACPFPLVGKFHSIEDALDLTVNPQVVNGYNWDRVSKEMYQEVKVELDDTLLRAEHTEEWNTTKIMQLEKIPKHFIIHLERFTYNEGVKALSNPKIQIPPILEKSIYSTSIAFEGKLKLRGGILHVSDDSAIEEEGHYVTVLRNEGKDQSGNSTWYLLDDETCSPPLNEERILDLLGGATDEKGRFCCGTLLAYSSEEEDPEMVPILSEIVRKAGERSSVKGALSLVNDPESVVGKRLRVRWAKGKYYTGVVDSYDESIGKHRIKYDDGDVRDYILERKTVEWI